MDLKGLKLFEAFHGKLSWLEQRQKLLSENISNADTPGFRPSDLKSLRFSEVLTRTTASAEIARTHPGHMKPPSSMGGSEVYEVRSLETKRNGNAVGLEQEMAKLAENQLTHGMVTNLYRKHVSMLRTALGRGRG